jgi:predicted Zn-dependent protease
MPGASLAFYGLGRTINVPDGRAAHSTGKAALFHRVALKVAPQNVLAGNELGVLLAQHGRLDDAQQMFQQCVAIEATPEAYRNLAAVYARKGDQRSSQAALAAGEALAAHDRSAAAAAGAAAIAQLPGGGEPAPAKPETSSTSKFRLPPPFKNIFRR